MFVLGAGGLGSPVLTYLGAAGVGEIAFADHDRVELSNLNRQVLYTEADLGRSKAAVAHGRLAAFNPDIRWLAHAEPLTAALAGSLLPGCDVAVDCADNHAARSILAAAAQRAAVPVIHGAVAGFEATVGVFDSCSGPCFACVSPAAAEMGEPPPVLGAAVGVVGCLMATETIRLLCGIGPDRRGQLLLVDLERGTFDWVKAEKRPGCPICGLAPVGS